MLLLQILLHLLQILNKLLQMLIPMLLKHPNFFLSLLRNYFHLDLNVCTFSLSSLYNFYLRRIISCDLRNYILFLASSADEKSCLSKHICSYYLRSAIISCMLVLSRFYLLRWGWCRDWYMGYYIRYYLKNIRIINILS